jgi:phosphoribosylformylglycinamidine synthase II
LTDTARVLVEVANLAEFPDPHAQAAYDEVVSGGRLPGLTAVRLVRTFDLSGPGLARAGALDAARSLLADPVVEAISPDRPLTFPEGEPAAVAWVRFRPGVMDPVGLSAEAALERRGFEGIRVETGRKLLFFAGPEAGAFDEETVRALVARQLANPVVEEISVGAAVPPPHRPPAPYRFRNREIALRDARDGELETISREHQLSLSGVEMQAIRDFFRGQQRDPTDVELLTLAQTWSEHCKHKTLRSRIDLDGEIIEGLLQQTVFRATRTLDRPDCLSVFKDNAGVIAFDDEYAVAFKVETHNHPSAIEPYGGAGTGIGGVIRDVLGTGRGARPILNTDVFCFAPTDLEPGALPRGTLHPRSLLKGVVAGVRDYGNRMGIPTVSGALYFDDRYVGNPVVYCGCLGILPRDCVEKAARTGDRVVSIGGRTGRDGIGGATFSSVELTSESEVVSATSVQIGNPIMEKRMLEGLLRARDEGLYTAVTDCGAGGLSSAVGEMGEDLGARVELSHVPLKYPGLSPAEIWLSEAQERMVLAVPPENMHRLREIMQLEGVEVSDLGAFTDDRRLHIEYEGRVVCDLPMDFLHDGLPMVTRRATWRPPEVAVPAVPEDADWSAMLTRILAMPDIASKEWVIRQYDHEVQGGSIIKPLQGAAADGPGDAVVVKPLLAGPRGVAVACGMNPHQGDLDPYHMAANAVDEALRNLAAVGCPPGRAALLDNFTWGNPGRPEMLGSLVRACRGCHDAAVAFGAPFVSGKDSLNNEFAHDGATISVPSTLLISAMGVIDDTSRCVTVDLKGAGHRIYLVGVTRAELGASHLHLLHGGAGGRIPRVDLDRAPGILERAAAAVREGLVTAAHDLSEGGLAVALAEMAFSGGFGADVDLERVPGAGEGEAPLSTAEILFAESPTRLLFEVPPDRAAAFEAHWKGWPAAWIGETTADRVLRGRRGAGRTVLEAELERLEKAWRTPLIR